MPRLTGWNERSSICFGNFSSPAIPTCGGSSCPTEWEGFPLRKEYGLIQQDDRWVRRNLKHRKRPVNPCRKPRFLDSTELVLNMARRSSTHGVLRVILKLDGEKVMGYECIIGYFTAGWRKIARTAPTRCSIPTWTGWTTWPRSQRVGLLLAVEKLLNVEARRGRRPWRVILTELNRSAQPLALARHARSRHRRHHSSLTIASRTRRSAQDFRELIAAPGSPRMPSESGA